MFGIFSFRKKTRKVLLNYFGYGDVLMNYQLETFHGVTKQIHSINGNEFDAAIAFMLIQLDSGSGFENGDADWVTFREKVIANAKNCATNASLEITKDTVFSLSTADKDQTNGEFKTPEEVSEEFDNLIDFLTTILLTNKSLMQNTEGYEEYIQSDAAFGYVSGFVDGYLQRCTEEYLDKVGQEEITIMNTVLSVVFDDLGFDQFYLPIDRLMKLHKLSPTEFINALISGGEDAFSLAEQDNFDAGFFKWSDHCTKITNKS